MLKMKASMETEAYIGANGHFVIKQKDCFDDDVVILLSYEQAIQIADYINVNCIELKEAWNNSVEQDSDLEPMKQEQQPLI